MTTTQATTGAYNPTPIRLYRQRKFGSQANAAQQARRHQTWWSRLESGKARLTADDLDMLARLFGIKKSTLARQIFDTPSASD